MMNNLIRKQIILILILCWFVNIKAENNQILIISTDGENYPASNILIESFKNEIQHQNIHVEYCYENLNLYLYVENKEEYYQSLAESYKIKYGSRLPSLIFAVEFGAVEFLKQYGDSIFKDIPILTAGTAETNKPITRQNWFQVLDTMAINQMFYATEKLQPKTKKIYAIIGDSSFEKEEKAWYRNKLQNYKGDAEIVFTNDVTYDEILKIASTADNNSIIFYIYFFQDVNGAKYIPKNVLGEIGLRSKVPVYAYMRHYISDQILGGYVISFRTLGEMAAHKYIEILKTQGKSIKSIERISTCEYVFNWQALQRFGIDSDLLPDESEIINQQYTIWQLYWSYILGGLVLILLQTILIIILVHNKRKRNLAEGELENVNRNLEQIVESQVVEIKEQNEILTDTNRQIVSLQKFKEVMTGTIVHDLKTHLHGIISPSKLLSLENKLEEVKLAGRKMLNMVLNILDIYKYESTAMSLEREACRLSELTNNAILEIRYFAERKSIRIENNIRYETGIYSDREILMRIFINLITNAIKHTPNNGRIIINDEDIAENPNYVKIRVSDNGVGVSEGEQQIVFEKFQQSGQKTQGNGHSSGLGLTFCKMAVEAHGGSIGIDSKTKIGTTVWFTIPYFLSEVKMQTGTVTKEKEIILSQDEKESLEEVISLLDNHEVYEITELRKILRKIEKEELGNEIWFQALKKSVNSCNKEMYEALIDKVKQQ